MTFLLVSYKGSFQLLSPSTYGLDTWGSNHQIYLEKKFKYWYLCTWIYGGDYNDDYYDEVKLNVVLETFNVDELLRFIINNAPYSFDFIISSLKTIIDDNVSLYKMIYKIGQKAD